ncbi:MAG: hypothetical protein N3I86_05595 [Verrucomicrobiae bacterium]|nr:hypothetical protein [Verrucomicrobiae bacterium]
MKRLRWLNKTDPLTALIGLMIWAAAMPPTAAQTTNAPATSAPPATVERARAREELQRLTPEERRERIRALRQQRLAPAPTPPDSEERRRELLQRKITELRRKKADGTLSAPEQAMLQRLEHALARRDAARTALGPSSTTAPSAAPTNAPPRAASPPP